MLMSSDIERNSQCSVICVPKRFRFHAYWTVVIINCSLGKNRNFQIDPYSLSGQGVLPKKLYATVNYDFFGVSYCQ